MKPHSGRKRGGAVGNTDVADERDRHRDHEHVAHEVEAAVVAQVEVQQRRDRDRASARSRTASSPAPSRRGCPRPTPGSRARRTRACARSSEIRSRAWANAAVGVSLDQAAHEPVGEVRERRTATPAAARPAIRAAGRAPAGDERGRPSRRSLDDAQRQRGPWLEDARQREADHDVQAPARARLHLRPVAGAARDAAACRCASAQ